MELVELNVGAPPPKRLSYESGHALMAEGTSALHQHLAKCVEPALGRPLPQMEIRVKNLSLFALETGVVTVHGNGNDHNRGTAKADLPTLPNEIKKFTSKINVKKQTMRKPILKDLNAVFKAGTMTLVLGQPGSGKSTLLKLLSARFRLTKSIQLDGDISYNGTSRAELLPRLPQLVTYVTQRDNHFPSLTVKETLSFAHACTGGKMDQEVEPFLIHGTPEQNQEAVSAIRALVQHFPDIVIQYLGLERCQNTIVGNAMLRGVSGGERKRVTTGEMEFGRSYAAFMDEITTGLDSAAAYDIIKAQKSMAMRLRKTIVMSLLQPPPEVFELFDDVLLLSEGEVLYYGPRESVVEYFETLGFRRPPHRDVADFLMDLGTPMQTNYQIDSTIAPPRRPSEFAKVFRRSETYQRTTQLLNEPVSPTTVEDSNFLLRKPEFHQSPWESLITLMPRQIKILLHNKPFVIGRTVMVIVMGLLYSSAYYNFDPADVQVVMGVIFTVIMFTTLGQATQIPTFMEDREIFYKQRAANFYRTSTFVIANAISRIPAGIAETLVFGPLVYWMCGFVARVDSFLFFEVLLFLTNIGFGAFFFFLAAIAPDVHIAKPLVMVTNVFFIISAGFVMSESNLPSYFIWIYWIDPIAWVFRAMAVNQYMNDDINVDVYEGVPYKMFLHKPMGQYFLDLFGIPSSKGWIWWGIVFMIGFYVVSCFLSYFVLEYIRYEHVENTGHAKKDEPQELESNYIELVTPRNALELHDRTVGISIKRTEKAFFTPVTLAFEDLWYSVPMPGKHNEYKDLLKGISGYARPGTMTALMGSSGAGKTTLMDVIAGRKTGGKIRGRILLNGYEATDLAIRRATGYCEQMDIHSDAATFREAFTFSAFLRQDSSVPDSVKYESVEECLDLLALGPIADKIIRGSSVEQMKRLTIGVELAAQPSVLFLDEPTSGLDARSAKLIMDGVRKVADTGRTVVCTIHQPSSEVFCLFDSLLLLRLGGETVYYGELGEKGTKMVNYFESIPGVGRLPPGYNPATWMLEVIGAGVDNECVEDKDFVKVFKESENKRLLDVALNNDGVTRPAANIPPLFFEHKRAASHMVQARLLMARFFQRYWRTASYNIVRFVILIFLGILFGVQYYGAVYNTFSGINAGVGMVFLTTAFLGFVCLYMVLPVSIEDRPAFYRERASQTYSAFWYFFASMVVEIPYVFISCFVFTAIFFPMVGFTGLKQFVLYWLDFSLVVLFQTYFGQLLAFVAPSMEVGASMGVLGNSICFLFMGFNPPAHSLPKGYRWLHQIIPQRYTLSFLISLVFGDCPHPGGTELGCQVLTDGPGKLANATIKTYVETVYQANYANLARDITVSLGFTALLCVAQLVVMRYVSFQKR